MSKPLTGYKVIELAGIGPAPYAGQVMADMGADVIVVQRPGFMPPMIDGRGKRSIIVDLRTEDGAKVVLDLTKDAHVLIEGLRPGVTERLGVGPDACHAINPKLVYGRMTGWGQTGPWAKTAGHDLNYISITGALAALGHEGQPPAPPLNLVGDYGGGSLFLVAGVLAALLQAERTGKGDIVDAAIVDGASSLMGIVYSLSGLGQWQPKRAANLVDGGAPYYRCYTTADGKYMAVGCIEPQFFALMLDLLEINPDDFGAQNNTSLWPQQHEMLENIFKTKTRDAWAKVFDGTDACVTPVLTYEEAPDHPHNKARGGLERHGHFIHPRPAPVFSTDDPSIADIPKAGAHTAAILSEIGYTVDQVEQLVSQKTVRCAK